MNPSRSQRRQLEQENARLPSTLTRVLTRAWPMSMVAEKKLVEVWRSRDYLLQIFSEPGDILRLTVCRTVFKDGDWAQDIPWEDLQRLKRECGRGAADAVEVYPADADLVNGANMRHLWVLPAPLTFAWRSTKAAP